MIGRFPYRARGPASRAYLIRTPMKYFVWLMLFAFAMVGTFCIREGMRSAILRRRRKPFLRKTQGVILRVDQQRKMESSTSNGRTRTRMVVKFHPVIQFRNEQGKPVQFRSEMGESYAVRKRWNGETVEPQSTYTTGQSLPVCYDIEGQLKPCIDTWAGRNGMNLGFVVAGLLFCGVSIVVGIAFANRPPGQL